MGVSQNFFFVSKQLCLFGLKKEAGNAESQQLGSTNTTTVKPVNITVLQNLNDNTFVLLTIVMYYNNSTYVLLYTHGRIFTCLILVCISLRCK